LKSLALSAHALANPLFHTLLAKEISECTGIFVIKSRNYLKCEAIAMSVVQKDFKIFLFLYLFFMSTTSSAQPECSSSRYVTFFEPWGTNSWLVNYTGPFLNDRPPHVEVGAKNMNNITAGEIHCLEDLSVAGKSALEWRVVGVFNSLQKNAPAHFTCYYGPNPKAQLKNYL